jgi:hypothetical protein
MVYIYYCVSHNYRTTFLINLCRYNGPQDDHCIQLAFSKKEIEGRKEWLTNHMEEGKRRKELGLAEQYLYEKVIFCVFQ